MNNIKKSKTRYAKAYSCTCSQTKCNNPNLPHFGACSACYLADKTPKERREFWIILSKHFNGV